MGGWRRGRKGRAERDQGPPRPSRWFSPAWASRRSQIPTVMCCVRAGLLFPLMFYLKYLMILQNSEFESLEWENIRLQFSAQLHNHSSYSSPNADTDIPCPGPIDTCGPRPMDSWETGHFQDDRNVVQDSHLHAELPDKMWGDTQFNLSFRLIETF